MPSRPAYASRPVRSISSAWMTTSSTRSGLESWKNAPIEYRLVSISDPRNASDTRPRVPGRGGALAGAGERALDVLDRAGRRSGRVARGVLERAGGGLDRPDRLAGGLDRVHGLLGRAAARQGDGRHRDARTATRPGRRGRGGCALGDGPRRGAGGLVARGRDATRGGARRMVRRGGARRRRGEVRPGVEAA